MVRTQIQITEQQARALKSIANRRGVPMAELIRQSIDQFLRDPAVAEREEQKRRAMAFAGKFSSDVTDLSTRHDDYLDEAYAAVSGETHDGECEE